MRDPLMAGIPICLETPAADKPLEVGELAVWKHEIELLYRIQRIEDEEWAKEEQGITEEWRKVRDVMNPPKEKKAPGGKGKGKKGKKGESEEED
jgi:AP endonuclease-1